MNIKQGAAIKVIVFLLALNFGFTTTATSAPLLQVLGQKSLSAAQLANRIEISSDWGMISERYADPNLKGPIVFHIQDAHGQFEAQFNTKQILKNLYETYGVKTVFQEGVLGSLDPSLIQLFDEKKDNDELVHSLAKKGLLTGAEVFIYEQVSENKNSKVKVLGVEDKDLYLRNLEAYRAVYQEHDFIETYLSETKDEIATQASRIMNKELYDFFREFISYEDMPAQLIRHLDVLQKYAKENLDIDLLNARSQIQWPQLLRYFKLQVANEDLNRIQAEKEFQEFLALMKKERINVELIEQFESWFSSKDDPLNDLNPRNLLERFYEATRPLENNFESYPNLKKLLSVKILSHELMAEDLIQEAQMMSHEIIHKLVNTNQEKRMIEKYRAYLRVRKLLTLELTFEDYQSFVKDETFYRQEFFNSDKLKTMDRVSIAYENSLNFYSLAVQREQAMFENMMEKIKASNDDRVALITGGFHATGFHKFFREHQISYVEVTPRITNLQEDNLYSDVMMLKPNPLSKNSYLGMPNGTDTAAPLRYKENFQAYVQVDVAHMIRDKKRAVPSSVVLDDDEGPLLPQLDDEMRSERRVVKDFVSNIYRNKASIYAWIAVGTALFASLFVNVTQVRGQQLQTTQLNEPLISKDQRVKYTPNAKTLKVISEGLARIADNNAVAGVGVHALTGAPLDHFVINNKEEIVFKAEYGAPSKDGVYLPSLLHVLDRNMMNDRTKTTRQQSLQKMLKDLKGLREFQLRGDGIETYAGLFPWNDYVGNKRELRLYGHDQRKMIPSLDNSQTSFGGLAALVGAFWDAKPGTYEAAIRDLADEIISAQDYSKMVGANGKLAYEYVFGRGLIVKDGSDLLSTEWAIGNLYAYLSGAITKEAWQNMDHQVLEWDSPAGKLDMLKFYIWSGHEAWILQYFSPQISKSEIYPLYLNYAYLHALHATQNDMAGFAATEYRRPEDYVPSGPKVEGLPFMNNPMNLQPEMATAYGTAIVATIHPPLIEWLQYYFEQPGVMTKYGPVTAFDRVTGASNVLTADNSFSTFNSASALGAYLEGRNDIVNRGILRYLKEKYGVTETDVIEAFNLHARAAKAEIGREFRVIDPSKIPMPPQKKNFSLKQKAAVVISPKLDLMNLFPAEGWFRGRMEVPTVTKEEFKAEITILTYDAPFAFIGSELATEIPIGAYSDGIIKGYQAISLWVPVNSKATWTIEFKSGADYVAENVVVNTADQGQLDPTGKWKRIIYSFDPDSRAVRLGRNLNTIAFSVKVPEQRVRVVGGAIHFKHLQFHKDTKQAVARTAVVTPITGDFKVKPLKVPDHRMEMEESYKTSAESGHPEQLMEFIRSIAIVKDEGKLAGFSPFFTLKKAEVWRPVLGADQRSESLRPMGDLLNELKNYDWIELKKIGELTFERMNEDYLKAANSGNALEMIKFIKKIAIVTNEGELAGFAPYYTIKKEGASDPIFENGKLVGPARPIGDLFKELDGFDWAKVKAVVPRSELRSSTVLEKVLRSRSELRRISSPEEHAYFTAHGASFEAVVRVSQMADHIVAEEHRAIEAIYQALMASVVPTTSTPYQVGENELRQLITESVKSLNKLLQARMLTVDGVGTAILSTEGIQPEFFVAAIPYFMALTNQDSADGMSGLILGGNANQTQAIKRQVFDSQNGLNAAQRGFAGKFIEFTAEHESLASVIARELAKKKVDRGLAASVTAEEVSAIQRHVDQILSMIHDPKTDGMSLEGLSAEEAVSRVEAYAVRTMMVVDLAAKLFMNAETIKEADHVRLVYEYFESRGIQVDEKGGVFGVSLQSISEHLTQLRQALLAQQKSA